MHVFLYSARVSSVTDPELAGARASCSTLELGVKKQMSWVLDRNVSPLTEKWCYSTYSSKSSRCSTGIVSSNTLKRSKAPLIKFYQTSLRMNTGSVQRSNSCQINYDMSVFYIQRWALDSLFVNRETGNRAVGSAGGGSQDFPARAKKTWHMSSQGNGKCRHLCKEKYDYCQKSEATFY